MEKKIIVWITPDYFYDTDSTIVGDLCKYYNIRWYVVWGKGSLLRKPANKNIYRLVEPPYHNRDIRIIKFYISLINEIKDYKPSVIYNGSSGLPFFYPLLFSLFDKHRIIHEGHEIDPYVSIEHNRLTVSDRLTVTYMKYYLRRVGLTQVFSKHSVQRFKELYPGCQCAYVPMVPKDFGQPQYVIDHKGKTVFLFFGKVYRKLKRFDLLLDAFLALDDKYSQKAELWVYGGCSGEERMNYEKMIEGHENIKAKFDFVPDEMIPVLFCSASYLVQPYQKITQSGPTMIAYNYNLPVIGSNIEGFKERIDDGKNGYLFEVDNLEDLKRVLETCIEQEQSEYLTIKDNLKNFVDQEYSNTAVIQKYCDMLDNFISKNG